jgi:hypothetical protein
MTVTITTNGELRSDQTSGIQNGSVNGGPAKDDYLLSSNLSQLPTAFGTFLNGLPVSASLLANAVNYGFGFESGQPAAGGAATPFFVNVATQGETINDLFFSQSDGSAFNGQIATFNGSQLHVAGSTDPIYLYSFGGKDILIGSTEAPADVDTSDPSTLDGGKLVFAYYLQENGAHTGADVWGVDFQPLDHPTAGPAAAPGAVGTSTDTHDDPIDFHDFLNVTATGSLTFNFDNLRSGNFLWVAVGSSTGGLLVTGRDLHVNPIGSTPSSKVGQLVSGGSDPSDTMNTSQGGQNATIGVNSQMFTAGNTAVMTLTSGLVPLANAAQATGTKVQDINYTDYLHTDGAALFISQTQGSGTVSLTIGAFNATQSGGGTATETSFGYIGGGGGDGNNGTSPSFEDDTPVGVDTVTVTSGNTVIGTWVDGTASDGQNQNGVTITIDGNLIHATGLSALETIHWTADTGQTFDRFQVTADSGTLPFDVGRVDVDKGLTVPKNIGASVITHDDGPAITAQIQDGVVDFATGSSVSNSLNGAVGTDVNDSNNEAKDGTKTYTITSFTTPTNVIPNLKGELSTDKTTVNYFTDGAGGTANHYDAAFDTLYYDLTLNQTDNSGAGSYTFTAHQDVVPQFVHFDFTDLPSNQSLFGEIAADKSKLGPGDLALVVVADNANLKSDGTYSNTSDTINSSKGGGEVTIGVTNQMFNPGDGAYFVFATDPDNDVVAGVGSGLSTKYDDADNLGFNGTKTTTTAQFEIVQNDTSATANIKAFDIDPGHVGRSPDTNIDTDSRDFVNNPEATDTQVSVTAVRVLDSSGNVLESVTIDQTTGVVTTITDGANISVASHDDDPGAGQTWSADVFIGVHNSKYTVEYDTAAPHDMARIGGVAGTFDIGGFNLLQSLDTPDQLFDFSVKVTDADLDTDGGSADPLANFEVEVDGTGQFHNNAPIAPLAASSTLATMPTADHAGSSSGLGQLGADTLHHRSDWMF